MWKNFQENFFCWFDLVENAMRSELSDQERWNIGGMRVAGKTIGDIAAAVNRHYNAVSNFLKKSQKLQE